MIDELWRWGWVELWPHATALLGIAAALLASGHAILFKRDLRSVVTWLLVVWLLPLVGALCYLLFGINRIKRRLGRLRPAAAAGLAPQPLPEEALAQALGAAYDHLWPLARLTQAACAAPLVAGNRVTCHEGGDRAYPEMLAAIDSAQRSVTLCAYIFDHDSVGLRFVDALAAAAARDVEVRVLVDAVGARYSWPRSILRALRGRGVRCAEFLPTRWPWRMPYANLRNHRKILVIDGVRGFTGGMNVRAGHCGEHGRPAAIGDLHFSFVGPVVRQFQQSFAEDWAFSTGELLQSALFFAEVNAAGPCLCRGVSDGPDEDLDRLRWTYQGGLEVARHRVRIVTPYFLPDPPLVAALCSAALRGVAVDIVLPAKSNLTLVHWATMGSLWQVLERGCQVWLTPPPFDHSKLMVVDGCWSLVGSGNWDPRSLRLNFEFNVECYDRALGGELDDLVASKIERAQPLTPRDVARRSLAVKLRDGTARLLSPYL